MKIRRLVIRAQRGCQARLECRAHSDWRRCLCHFRRPRNHFRQLHPGSHCPSNRLLQNHPAGYCRSFLAAPAARFPDCHPAPARLDHRNHPNCPALGCRSLPGFQNRRQNHPDCRIHPGHLGCRSLRRRDRRCQKVRRLSHRASPALRRRASYC